MASAPQIFPYLSRRLLRQVEQEMTERGCTKRHVFERAIDLALKWEEISTKAAKLKSRPDRGRPARDDYRKTSASVSAEHHRKLHELAASKGMFLTDILEAALELLLQDAGDVSKRRNKMEDFLQPVIHLRLPTALGVVLGPTTPRPAIGAGRSLIDLRAGTKVLLDASVFVHAVVGARQEGTQRSSEQCRGLLGRCKVREVEGYVSTHTLTRLWDYLERLRAAEADAVTADPETVVPRPAERVASLAGSLLRVFAVETAGIDAAAALVEGAGLEVGAALTLISFRRLTGGEGGPVQIATANAEYERLEGPDYQVFKPSDLPRAEIPDG